MDINLNWTGAAVIVSILAHLVVLVIWGTRISSKADNLVGIVAKFQEEIRSRDTQLIALWKKVDDLVGRMIRIEVLQTERNGD